MFQGYVGKFLETHHFFGQSGFEFWKVLLLPLVRLCKQLESTCFLEWVRGSTVMKSSE